MSGPTSRTRAPLPNRTASPPSVARPRVLGIDPGLRRTGFGVIEVGPSRRHRLVQFGVIRPNDKLPLESRLRLIFDGLTKVIAEHQPTHVAVESIYQARNVSSALLLGHARAAALLSAAVTNLPLRGYAPSTVKAHVSGYGLASKEQVSYMVSRILGLPGDLQPGDSSDALALAICGADLPPETDDTTPSAIATKPRRTRSARFMVPPQ